ncbi:hypothetical protein ACK3TF_003665 [Chlorella vulgaris]
MSREQDKAGGQLNKASARLSEVAEELHDVSLAARQAATAGEAEWLKQQAAGTIQDVARMLTTHGPAVAEIVEEDLSMLHNSSKLVMQRGSDDGSGGAHSAPPCGQAAQAHSPKAHDAATLPAGARHEGNAEETL